MNRAQPKNEESPGNRGLSCKELPVVLCQRCGQMRDRRLAGGGDGEGLGRVV